MLPYCHYVTVLKVLCYVRSLFYPAPGDLSLQWHKCRLSAKETCKLIPSLLQCYSGDKWNILLVVELVCLNNTLYVRMCVCACSRIFFNDVWAETFSSHILSSISSMILLWTSCFSALKYRYFATHTQPLHEKKVGGRCHATASRLIWKRPSTHCTGGWMGPENVSPTRVSTLDSPAHCKSLYWLLCPSRTCRAVPRAFTLALALLSQPNLCFFP
jgi:hypothetical protein